ncbi:hypothetical protein PRLR6025_20850 [Prevotella lacticifex]|nr:hypothetical protein PRLR6025_20850 [Prevotella lacticifex]
MLFEQIELYKPNIICFGGTFKYFKKDLGLSDSEPIDGARVYKRKSQLLLDLYHPQQRTISRGDYVDNVIDCIAKWYNH